jgi:DNA-binding MurR/RpiR family transcriptional regulator
LLRSFTHANAASARRYPKYSKARTWRQQIVHQNRLQTPPSPPARHYSRYITPNKMLLLRNTTFASDTNLRQFVSMLYNGKIVILVAGATISVLQE